MADSRYTKIEITYSNSTMTLCFDKFSPTEARFDDDINEEATPGDFHLEINIARVFHKVLNLLKTNEGLFEKRDYELLGEMLEKLLFGRISSTGDSRVADMEKTERILSLTNDSCRIFLNFNQPSQIAVLPWEYTFYRSRGSIKPGKAWYLSANTDVPFHLVRRVASAPTPDFESDRLLIVVVMNLLGNDAVTPAIDSRTRETSNLKAIFKSLQEEESAPELVVKYIENKPVLEVIDEMKNIYQNWQQEYGGEPAYVVHYIGHAALLDEKGQIATIDKEGKACWMEDTDFARYFKSDVLGVKSPALVCLQACDSGKIGNHQNELRGVAYELAKLKIPAVVGMQNEINIPDSSAFFTVFYRSLLSGKDVAEATTMGRNHLGREMNRPYVYQTNAFGSPVLFITTEEPVKLLKWQPPEVKETPSGEAVSFLYKNDPSLRTTESRIRAGSGASVAADVGSPVAPAQSPLSSQTDSASRNESSNTGN